MDIYIIVTRLHVYTNLYVYNFSRFKQSFDILRCVACDVIYVWRRIDRQTNKCLLGKQNTTPKSRTYTVLSFCTYKFVPVYAQSSVHNSIHLCVIASICFMTSLPFVVKVISILFCFIFSDCLCMSKNWNILMWNKHKGISCCGIFYSSIFPESKY